MSSSTFPDDVPIEDAVEQQQPTADLTPDPGAAGSGTPPLESDPGDWQEQHQTLVDPDPDEERR